MKTARISTGPKKCTDWSALSVLFSMFVMIAILITRLILLIEREVFLTLISPQNPSVRNAQHKGDLGPAICIHIVSCIVSYCMVFNVLYTDVLHCMGGKLRTHCQSKKECTLRNSLSRAPSIAVYC